MAETWCETNEECLKNPPQGTAFAKREIRPAGLIWISRMCKYIRMYGYKFPKEDHLALVRLFYDLLIQPDMEPWMANKAAATVVTLLKKRELIGPEDGLALEWRPLYELYERLLYSKVRMSSTTSSTRL